MCGRFIQMFDWAEVTDFADLMAAVDARQRPGAGGGEGDDQEVVQSPMRFAKVVHLDPRTGQRRVSDMRWGWPDARNPDPRARPKHMHARAESIDRLPTFRDSFALRRGLVFVKSFNVGEELPSGKIRQWCLTRPAGEPMVLAVIWRECQADAGEIIPAYVMVTVAANPLVAAKTDRMPAILAPDGIALWLGEHGAPLEQVQAMLKPYAGELVLTDPTPPKQTRTATDTPFKRQTQNELF
ncbi:MAG TPA: SOS response-associated peptidase family protein [Candidatus Sulfotelmatobacter sp.]|nr:SOS response-associated peptidase family protein [Candidatus Sulfotelmatobacter sp.]